MRRIVFAAALAGLVLMAGTDWGRAQTNEPGPGEGGSVLKDPLATPVPTQISPLPKQTYVESLLDKNPSGGIAAQNSLASKLAALALSNASTLNDDIKIRQADGPFVIYIQSYIGEDCHKLARQMVTELRSAYKLNAFTFNKGAEEKRKEYERVMDVIAKKRELYQKSGVPADVPIRVGFMNIQEQCAVILGGYKSEESARRSLDGIRNLKPLDPNKVMLDKLYAEEIKKDARKTEKLQEGYVNPFLGAFVGHNPTIKQVRPADWDKPDMVLLQKLNATESFSLLHCKKAFTLAVKDFQTPNMLQTKSSPGSFLDNLTGAGKSGSREDKAAINAHNLAEVLRKNKLEAYVLHTKYCSVVCVGGFDSKKDPSMHSMANLIETKVLPQIALWFPPPPNQPIVHARAVPMPIPPNVDTGEDDKVTR